MPPHPDHPAHKSLSAWDARVVLALAGLAILVRVALAALFYGTSDVMAWELLGQLLLNGENFYSTELHNWPPLWIYFLSAIWLVHAATGLSFAFLVKLPAIAADAFIVVLLYRAGLRFGWSARAATLTALAYALHPIAVFISGYHGQFDS